MFDVSIDPQHERTTYITDGRYHLTVAPCDDPNTVCIELDDVAWMSRDEVLQFIIALQRSIGNAD